MTVEEPPSLTTPLKLVKPDISAFSFSGYLQKSSKSNTKVGPTPRTPSKKINTKMLFTGPPTPLFTHQRHPSGSSNELRSDGTFEFQDSHSNLDTLFSPFLSSDDRDMVSPSFSRRIERSSSFGGSSPIAHRSELDNEEPAEFDFESVDDKIMNTDANLPSWIVDSPNFLSPEFFQKLDQNPYFLGFLNEQPQSGAEYFLENFKIIEIIGRGDFADVYKCLDLSDQMFYSIKKTREVFTGFNDRCRKLEEARVLFDIGKHPHCLRAHVSWEQRGCFYIQSELCELGTLANFINRVSFQEEYVSEQLIWAILLHISLVSLVNLTIM